MLKYISKEIKATLLLIAAVQIVSGATVSHGRRETSSLQRDRLMAQSLGDMGATIKCLLQLQRPGVYDKIYNVWNEHFERIQLHPTKPLNSDLSMDVLYEKGSVTLKQLQSIDDKCSTLPYVCGDNVRSSEDNAPKDLKDMGTNLEILAGTMQCALKQTADQEQLHRIFDSSFERMHSNYDASATPLSKVSEEILETTTEIRVLNGECKNTEFNGNNACIPINI